LDINCVSPASKSFPAACQFTDRQERLLQAARQTAASRVERGLQRVETGREGNTFARELAERLFRYDPPTVTEVVAQLRTVRDFLRGAQIEFAGRSCGDTTCQSVATVAYVNGAGQLPIYVCPTAFSALDSLHRTVLHEALHWTGLDADPATPEGYCERFDCQTPCLTKNDADGWSHFLDCLGQPIERRRSFIDKILESVNEIP
jgi:hypothetical protein